MVSAKPCRRWVACVEVTPILGAIKFGLPAAQSRKSRAVRQNLRVTRLGLKPPATHPKDEAIEPTALLAHEVDPPEGEAPIEWLLLTNYTITPQEDAGEALSGYLCRWQIAIFFRILKS